MVRVGAMFVFRIKKYRNIRVKIRTVQSTSSFAFFSVSAVAFISAAALSRAW